MQFAKSFMLYSLHCPQTYSYSIPHSDAGVSLFHISAGTYTVGVAVLMLADHIAPN